MSSKTDLKSQQGAARCEAISWQELLDQETVPVPLYLREDVNPDKGDEDLPFHRYISRDFHLKEKEKLWPKVWQMTCREEDIPEAGDHFVYDICDESVLIVRGEDNKIRAFINACLHRGRTLRDESGQVSELRCPFHGFTWRLDGSFSHMPCAWDFKHLEKVDMRLPQLKLDTWGGFIFVNFDDESGSLHDYLGVMPEHFARFPLEDYFTGVHVQRVVPSNWKVAHEAFMESWHTIETHSQILTFTGDANSQYDCFGDNVSRSVTPMAVPSPHLSGVDEKTTMKDILKLSGRMALDDDDGLDLPDDISAREYIGELNRQLFSEASGENLDDATHAELLDAILYSSFPNFQVWIGYHGNIVYQFRPNGDDHETAIMNVRVLLRYPKGTERPDACEINVIDPSLPFESAPELGALGEVFDQDVDNLQALHKGMKTSKRGAARLASYQESRIRHLHQTIDKYVNA
jgi:phenylpropionate dioxygenase-like ring-hydroxylating dioxygenase large terminal subunit